MRHALRPNPQSMPEWLDRLLGEGYEGRLERAFGIRLGKMIACGMFGCTFEVRDHQLLNRGKLVLKITSDRTEGPNQYLIGKYQRAALRTSKESIFGVSKQLWDIRRGYAIVEGVVKVWGKKITVDIEEDAEAHVGKGGVTVGGGPRPIYAILREDVIPATRVHPGRLDPPLFPAEAAILSDNLSFYRDLAFKRQFMKKRDVIAEAERLMGVFMRQIRKLAPALGAGMTSYWELTGTPMSDIHVGNVGVRWQPGMLDMGLPQDGMGQIVAYDPGYTRTKAASRVQASIQRVNPKG